MDITSQRSSLLVLGLLFSSGLFAITGNGIVIQETSGRTQQARHITVHKCFGQGEMPNFPRPRVSGVPLAQWQSDVDTRWPDGSTTCSFVTFVQRLEGRRSVSVDFVNDPNSCHLGDLNTCQAAALSRTEMLSFNSSGWSAQLNTTGIDASIQARTMLQQLTPQYFLRGPLVTQVIVGETDRIFDFGSNAAKSLHPIWVLTFWPGQTAVKIEAILENCWTDTLQDQHYEVSIKTGAPGSEVEVWSKPQFRHWAKGRWRKQVWSGAEPGSINVDHNFEHLKSTMLVPNYDPSRRVGPGELDFLLKSWSTSDKAEVFSPGTGGWSGLYATYQPATGGRSELAYLPRWQVAYLYTMRAELWDMISKQADMQGYQPIHFREAAKLSFLDTNGDGAAETQSAFGKWVSIDARPTADLSTFSPVTPLAPTPWSIDASHTPSMTYLPWVIGGDWYWRQEQQAIASYYLLQPNPLVCSYCRHRNWGIYLISGERRHAWPMRHFAHAAIVSAPRSAEKAYFTDKVNKNLEAIEGYRGIKNGAWFRPNPGGTLSNPCPGYSTTTATVWCWAYTDAAIHKDGQGSQLQADARKNPLHFPSICPGDVPTNEQLDPTRTSSRCSPWMFYYVLVVHGAMKELGFKVEPSLDFEAQHLISMVQHPDYDPYLLAAYRIPNTGPPPLYKLLESWAAVKAAYDPSIFVKSFPAASLGSLHGYATLAAGASSFITPYTSWDGYSGVTARAWIEANIVSRIPNDGVNMWTIVPRRPER